VYIAVNGIPSHSYGVSLAHLLFDVITEQINDDDDDDDMGSHSITCHPTQVNTPRLNPSHTGRYSIYLPRRDGRLS